MLESRLLCLHKSDNMKSSVILWVPLSANRSLVSAEGPAASDHRDVVLSSRWERMDRRLTGTSRRGDLGSEHI